MCGSSGGYETMTSPDLSDHDKSADSDSAVWLAKQQCTNMLPRKAKSTEALDNKVLRTVLFGCARSDHTAKDLSLESELVFMGQTLATPVLAGTTMDIRNNIKSKHSSISVGALETKRSEAPIHESGKSVRPKLFSASRMSRSLCDVRKGLTGAAGLAHQFSHAWLDHRRRAYTIGSAKSDEASKDGVDITCGRFMELPSELVSGCDTLSTSPRIKCSLTNLSIKDSSSCDSEPNMYVTEQLNLVEQPHLNQKPHLVEQPHTIQQPRLMEQPYLMEHPVTSTDTAICDVQRISFMCQEHRTSKRNPSLVDIKKSGWYESDSLQSKSSSEYADLPPTWSGGEFSDFYNISDSIEDVTLTSQYGVDDLLKPMDSGDTTYSSSSRKSSATSDSAIDLHPGTDDTSGDMSPVPNPINPYVVIEQNEDELKTAEFVEQFESDSALNSGNEECLSRYRCSFADAQTPSFTRLPPSVIISDHSQDNQSVSPVHCYVHQSAEAQYLGIYDAVESIDHDAFDRKSSTSSIASDLSARSYLSDASLSVDEDDYPHSIGPLQTKQSVS